MKIDWLSIAMGLLMVVIIGFIIYLAANTVSEGKKCEAKGGILLKTANGYTCVKATTIRIEND